MNLGIIASSIQVSGGASYLLDTHTGVGAAYSLRKISSTATNAIQIKRNSDSSTTNIGFVGNDLDTTAINTFCSGTTCTVETWYDQGPNGYNLGVAPTPWTIYSGSLVTLNGSPALQNQNSNNAMAASVSKQNITGSSQMYVIVTVAPASGAVVADLDNDQIYIEEAGCGYYDSTFSNVVGYSSASTFTYGVQGFLEIVFQNSSNLDVYQSGSLLSLDVDAPGTYAPTGIGTLSVGGDVDAIQEIIFWPVNKSASRSAIYSDVNTY